MVTGIEVFKSEMAAAKKLEQENPNKDTDHPAGDHIREIMPAP